MSPELLNKAFSTKFKQCIYCVYDEKPNGTLFSTYKNRYVAASAETDAHTQTHSLTHRTTTVTLVHAPRVNKHCPRYIPRGKG